ncbi:hypothetical protein BJ165DRAFT_1402489 [Panaeolus papilionaceus]|nr:hypothetical protein BJ165DRAFT_1402489 [Panaeolus papilionaceus]
MPPKKVREQRQNTVITLPAEVIAKRNKRHLDELERSNYTEANDLTGVVEEGGEEGSKATSRGRDRQTISDKRNLKMPGTSRAATKKKSTFAVREALLYRKNLNTLIASSKLEEMPPDVPTYLTAATIRPTYPPRLMCSVCGYWGTYKCRRCALPYCDLNCEGVHNETRCERRVFF